MRIAAAALLLTLSLAPLSASAVSFANKDDQALDRAGLTALEQRAESADPREQCFLFTELVHVYADMAGKQLAAGEVNAASASLKRIEHFSERIHMGLARDTKRLKRAEMTMHATTYRLGELLHTTSEEDKAVVQKTLKQLDKVHDELLAQVFAH